ncbi:type III secretion protein [Pseudomonas haemolytica]|uniref:Type III secretion protein n=1 Tax=Pseudomonas haemolytica TaxID=2600065 RepID=A0A5P1D6C3_9PSED|nr:type III secretion protein [Pseudomonas haemolytica]MRJ35906.1 type III secretion protein [Pseudomonas haemolytica]
MIKIDAIHNMVAMARAHQALERRNAQEQARSNEADSLPDTHHRGAMITPPDDDIERKITYP